MVRLKAVALAVGVWALAVVAAGVPSAATAANSDTGKGIVYLLRGGLNVFSTGMDEVAAKLRDRGVNARSVGFASWQDVARAAADQYRQSRRPIVFGGHSFGANAAILAAEQLGKNGIPVALVVLFDPTDPLKAPPNVKRVINFVSADSLGYNVDVQPAAGLPGQVENILHAEVNHMTIDNDANIQQQAIDAIAKIVGARARTSAR